MTESKDNEVQELDEAFKVFFLWFKVLLETEHMNDPEHRKDYLQSLETISETIRQKEGGN